MQALEIFRLWTVAGSRLYLAPDELAFLFAETRIDINTKEALRMHLMDIQAKAYKVSVRVCVLFPWINPVIIRSTLTLA